MKYLIALILIISYYVAAAQNSTKLSSTIIDIETNEPVPYVNVYLKDKRIGTYTNTEGYFVLSVSHDVNETDSLVFSSIGYQMRTILVSEIRDTTYLMPSTEILNEVSVLASRKKINAKNIVKESIKRIPQNYDFEKELVGFYRQLHYFIPLSKTKFERKKWPELNESLREYLFSIESYVSHDRIKNKSTILQLRRSNDFRDFKFSESTGKGRSFGSKWYSNKDYPDKVRSSERTIYTINGFLKLDPVWSSKNVVSEDHDVLASQAFSNLNSEFVKKHSFKLDEVTYLDTMEVYVIKILPNSKSYRYTKIYNKHSFIPIGRIYIEPSEYKILKIEYSYIKNPKQKGWYGQVINTLQGGNTLYRDTYLYSWKDDNMVLSYARRVQRDEMAHSGIKKGNESQSGYHYVIREFLGSKQFETPSQIIQGDIYSSYQYTPSFWQNQNMILLNKIEEEKLQADLENKGIPLAKQFFLNQDN